MTVEVVHWNPKRPIFDGFLGRVNPIRKRVNNFGDLLGPEIVKRIAIKRFGLDRWNSAQGRVLAVGSILSLARPGDIVWGIGANGKSLSKDYDLSGVSFRAVRGPLTRKFVRQNGGDCPEIYGDPGLLVSYLWSDDELQAPQADVTIIPNLNDLKNYDLSDPRILVPTSPLDQCLARIRTSRFVVGSSLHGIIVAESFGVPARLIKSSVEPDFKYLDYYLGSGRSGFLAATSVEGALRLGGEPPPIWDASRLLAAFPVELWEEKALSPRRSGE